MLAGREARDPLVTAPLGDAARKRLREQHHSAFVPQPRTINEFSRLRVWRVAPTRLLKARIGSCARAHLR